MFQNKSAYRINKGKCQTYPRIDVHETIVAERCETFRYCHIGGIRMTSAELKHRVKLQEWGQHAPDNTLKISKPTGM